jgi:hypothetical protein
LVILIIVDVDPRTWQWIGRRLAAGHRRPLVTGRGAARHPVEQTLGLPDRQIQLHHTALDLAVVENAPLDRAQRRRQRRRRGLKTLKRAMYGSAGGELLRARMLPIRPTEQHAN